MGAAAGLHVYDVVVKKFTFAILSPDEYSSTTHNSLPRLPSYVLLRTPYRPILRLSSRRPRTVPSAFCSRSAEVSSH